MKSIAVIQIHNFDWKITHGLLKHRSIFPNVKYMDYIPAVKHQDDFMNAIRVESLIRSHSTNSIFIENSKLSHKENFKDLDQMFPKEFNFKIILSVGTLFKRLIEPIEENIPTCNLCLHNYLRHGKTEFFTALNYCGDLKSENFNKKYINKRFEFTKRVKYKASFVDILELGKISYVNDQNSNTAGLDSLFSNIDDINYDVTSMRSALSKCMHS